MPLANCKQCGKLFRKVVSDTCPDCQREEEKLLRETLDHLREHPEAMISDISDELEIEKSLIEKWIREGRITIIDPDHAMSKPKCVKCGREIKEGQTYCRTCMFKQLQGQSKRQAPAQVEEKHTGMHYKPKPR